MRNFVALILALLMSFPLLLIQGCDWDDTGSESFNTSRGGGVTVNFSGYYRPKSGAFLVSSNITHFVLTQVGNSIEVYDNNMSYYTGSIGTPGIMARPSNTTGLYPPGAVMLQAQVSFSGRNIGTDDVVQFVGVIHAVAVDDVQGNNSTLTTTTDSVLASSTNTSGTTAIDILAPPVTINDTTTTAGENSNSSQTTLVNTTTTTYQITEANSQYVLEGNWIEGGSVSGIAAIAPGTGSTFSTVATTTTTP